MSDSSIKTAVFGGSFNPIHLGHIKVAKTVKDKFGIDRVLIIPTYTTPLKDNCEMVSPQHRFNMCKLMCREYLDIFVSDIEITRQGKSYTVDTLKRLKRSHPTDEFFLIVGADMFLTIDKWRNAEKIFSYASVCTVPRDDLDYRALLNKSAYLSKLGAQCKILKEPVMDISSTQIRQMISEGKDISPYVGNEVAEYIAYNNLYRE